jgi:hypothetical protein
MARELVESGPQSKAAILKKQGLSPLVLSIPAAAAMVGLSENAAIPLFRAWNIPILPMGPSRRVVRVADLERLLDALAEEAV